MEEYRWNPSFPHPTFSNGSVSLPLSLDSCFGLPPCFSFCRDFKFPLTLIGTLNPQGIYSMTHGCKQECVSDFEALVFQLIIKIHRHV
uniref:Uncharacterized protein n=1 Tax=Nelumbo nucifera TaxID=4432 RepID=A0A822ZK81_NELNU|nr:TPA_asm: hypothetical protein HUJ06_001999 [Nelumbo nucifera]